MIHIRDKEHEGKAMQIINDYDAESKRLDVSTRLAIQIERASRMLSW